MSKYAEYDEELLRLIRNGCRTAGSLMIQLADQNREIQPAGDAWRVTDRRLQSLRRAKKIIFSGGHWYEHEEQP